MGTFLLTLQKNPAILQCTVTDIWTGQTQILKVVFGQNFKIFGQIRICFLLYNFSKYVNCEKSFKFLHVRKKTILKIKIAKNAQKLPKFDILKS